MDCSVGWICFIALMNRQKTRVLPENIKMQALLMGRLQNDSKLGVK